MEKNVLKADAVLEGGGVKGIGLAVLLSTMMEAHDACYIEDEHFVRTIPIPTSDIKTTEFDISREKSETLYQSGREAAEKFFATWDFVRYIDKFRRGGPITKPKRPPQDLPLRPLHSSPGVNSASWPHPPHVKLDSLNGGDPFLGSFFFGAVLELAGSFHHQLVMEWPRVMVVN